MTDWKAFKRWLKARGCEERPPLDFEAMRFKTRNGTLIVYDGKRGRKPNTIAREALTAFEEGDDEYLAPVKEQREQLTADEAAAYLRVVGKPITIAEMAATTGAMMPECIRVLFDMVDAGTVTRTISRRGPMLFLMEGRGGDDGQ